MYNKYMCEEYISFLTGLHEFIIIFENRLINCALELSKLEIL